jgi:cell division protease FtsH
LIFEIKLYTRVVYSKNLRKSKDKLNQLADILIEKEVIFKDDLETIFGKRAFDKNLEEIVS